MWVPGEPASRPRSIVMRPPGPGRVGAAKEKGMATKRMYTPERRRLAKVQRLHRELGAELAKVVADLNKSGRSYKKTARKK